MVTGLSEKAMREIIKDGISMDYVSIFGTWHIKVRGEQVISGDLHYRNDKYMTYDVEDNYINLCELSMDRPALRIETN